MHSQIWQKIHAIIHVECWCILSEDILCEFEIFKGMSIGDIVRFVKESGALADFHDAGGGENSGSCFTDYILRYRLEKIESWSTLEKILLDEGMLDDPVVGSGAFEKSIARYTDVAWNGGADNRYPGETAWYFRFLQIFDRAAFIEAMREQGSLRSIVTTIDEYLHDGPDYQAALVAFRRYGFNLQLLVMYGRDDLFDQSGENACT